MFLPGVNREFHVEEIRNIESINNLMAQFKEIKLCTGTGLKDISKISYKINVAFLYKLLSVIS